MPTVTVMMGMGNRATDPHSSQPPIGQVACAESSEGLGVHGNARGGERSLVRADGGWTASRRGGTTVAPKPMRPQLGGS